MAKSTLDHVIKQHTIRLIQVLANKARQKSSELTIERNLLGLGKLGFVTLHIGFYGDFHYVDTSTASSALHPIDLHKLEPEALLRLAIELAELA